MKKFENTRKHDGNITSQSFKYEIPYVYYHPLKITTDSIIFVYVGGNGSTIALFDLMNYPLFDQHYLFAFERMAHGNNRNRAKRFYPSYIKELDIVLTQVKTLIPNHKIYLLGESWGSALACLYLKKYPNKIAGAFIWNMPYKIKDAAATSWGHRLRLFFTKLIPSYFLGIQTYDSKPNNPIDKLSSNPLLIRITKVASANKPSNNVSDIAAWLSFKPAWRFIVKNFNNDNLQLFYFQSGEDFLCDYQRWKRITQQFPTSKHIINYPRGYHILFLEENNQVNIQLFNDILARV